MITVIMAGGKGTRLWPLSVEQEPKQFVKFVNGKSLFQLTLERFKEISSKMYVVTIDDYAFTALDQASEVGVKIDGIIREPLRRGTLSAMVLSVKEIGGNEPILFTPADHVMDPFPANQYEDYARFYLLIFGLKPRFPSTDYGYVLPGDELEPPIKVLSPSPQKLPSIPRRVIKFREKPDKETAAKYVSSGYLWNSGIYMFSPDVFIEELRKYSPKHYAFLKNELNYEDLPDTTVDYTISENSNKIAVVPIDVNWTDLGSFKAIYRFFDKDHNSNVIIGKANIDNVRNSLIINCDEKPIAIGSLTSYAIVQCHDRLFIGPLEDTKLPKKFSNL